MQVDTKQARLGRLLFYDPILSGNRNISCGTCHAPEFASTDGLALGLGEGGIGLGPNRRAGQGASAVHQRQSRNAPGLWNLGLRDVQHLFHDGRVAHLDGATFTTPAGPHLPAGVTSLLAAQSLFPLIARTEMAGDPGENNVANAAQTNARAAWALLAQRVANIPGYATRFPTAFEDVQTATDIKIHHIANALGAFVSAEWRAINTPFDQYLNGSKTALTAAQKRGMALFYGPANCANCHSGPILSDQKFHALGLPQFGPGLTRRFDPVARDVGRMATTDSQTDAYRFATPMLRNVALTPPYGHNGAYASLTGIIRHHLSPVTSLNNWSPDSVNLPGLSATPQDFALHTDKTERQRLRAALSITPLNLRESDIADLVAFLHSLTDETQKSGRLGKPSKVPSGLTVD